MDIPGFQKLIALPMPAHYNRATVYMDGNI